MRKRKRNDRMIGFEATSWSSNPSETLGWKIIEVVMAQLTITNPTMAGANIEKLDQPPCTHITQSKVLLTPNRQLNSS